MECFCNIYVLKHFNNCEKTERIAKETPVIKI